MQTIEAAYAGQSAPTLRRVAVPGVQLTIALPSMLERTYRAQGGNDFRTHWGSLQHDPIAIRVVARLPDEGADAATSEQAFAEAARAWTDVFPGSFPAQKRGETEEMPYGPHRVLVSRWTYGDGIVLERFALRVRGFTVFMDAYESSATPAAWVDLVPEIVGSLAAADGPRPD